MVWWCCGYFASWLYIEKGRISSFCGKAKPLPLVTDRSTELLSSLKFTFIQIESGARFGISEKVLGHLETVRFLVAIVAGDFNRADEKCPCCVEEVAQHYQI